MFSINQVVRVNLADPEEATILAGLHERVGLVVSLQESVEVHLVGDLFTRRLREDQLIEVAGGGKRRRPKGPWNHY